MPPLKKVPFYIRITLLCFEVLVLYNNCNGGDDDDDDNEIS